MESKFNNNNRPGKVENKGFENKNVNEVTIVRKPPNNLRFPQIGKFKKVDDDERSPFIEVEEVRKKKSFPSTPTQIKPSKKKQKNKSLRKKAGKNRLWDGPKPNCAWDGPGGCGGVKDKEPVTNIEVQTENKVVIEKSRFSNLLPKRLEVRTKENFSLDSLLSSEDPKAVDRKKDSGFDKSKLLPGKTVKQRIQEHLKQREKDKRKQTRVKSFPSSARPGLSSTVAPVKAGAGEVVGVELYSVEEWLRMG